MCDIYIYNQLFLNHYIYKVSILPNNFQMFGFGRPVVVLARVVYGAGFIAHLVLINMNKCK